MLLDLSLQGHKKLVLSTIERLHTRCLRNMVWACYVTNHQIHTLSPRSQVNSLDIAFKDVISRVCMLNVKFCISHHMLKKLQVKMKWSKQKQYYPWRQIKCILQCMDRQVSILGIPGMIIYHDVVGGMRESQPIWIWMLESLNKRMGFSSPSCNVVIIEFV